ncbi:unnamed protein product, partial [Effrenium voratum]
ALRGAAAHDQRRLGHPRGRPALVPAARCRAARQPLGLRRCVAEGGLLHRLLGCAIREGLPLSPQPKWPCHDQRVLHPRGGPGVAAEAAGAELPSLLGEERLPRRGPEEEGAPAGVELHGDVLRGHRCELQVAGDDSGQRHFGAYR